MSAINMEFRVDSMTELARLLVRLPDIRNQPGARAVSRVDTGLKAAGLH
jgi:hypothetical protein